MTNINLNIRRILGVMPKTRHQESPLKPNSDGSYYIRPWIDILTDEGVVRKQQTYNLGSNKNEAKEKRREILNKINNAEQFVKSQIKFKVAIDDYKKLYLNKLAKGSRNSIETILNRYIVGEFGEKFISAIKTRDIQEWIDGIDKSFNYKQSIKSRLSEVFDKAILWEYWNGRNPVDGVILRDEEEIKEKRKFTVEQTRNLLAELEPLPRLSCEIALYCTLRICEVLGLQEKHLNFQDHIIMIQQKVYLNEVGKPKTKKSTRNIAMGMLEERLKKVCRGEMERFIIGENYTYQQLLKQHLKPAAKKLGLDYKGFGFHVLRREAITEHGKSNPMQTANMAGHESLDTSLIYTLKDYQEQALMVNSLMQKIELCNTVQ